MSLPQSPIFTGEHYNIWMVKMKTHLLAAGLWDYVGKGKEPINLPANPTVAQLKQHREENSKKYTALMILQGAVTDAIFTRIAICESPKEAWDKLKEEFQGSVVNLRRDFEYLRMKDSETVKAYADRIMAVVSNIRLLGEDFSESRIVEKVITTLPEKYEAKISSLSLSRDITKMNLTELVNALYAREQRRANRLGETTEGAFMAKGKEKAHEEGSRSRRYQGRKGTGKKEGNREGGRMKFGPCSHCKKTGHAENDCWFRVDIQCRACKQFGHIEKVCKNKVQQ